MRKKYYLGKFYKLDRGLVKELIHIVSENEGDKCEIENIIVKYSLSEEHEECSITVNEGDIWANNFIENTLLFAEDIEPSEFYAFKDIANAQLSAAKALYQNIEIKNKAN
jgi:hypothetical protein